MRRLTLSVVSLGSFQTATATTRSLSGCIPLFIFGYDDRMEIGISAISREVAQWPGPHRPASG